MGGRSNRWIGRAKRLALYRRDEECCRYCGVTLAELQETDRPYLTLDHLYADRGNDPSNLITACHPCNTAKGRKTVDEFVPPAKARAIKKWARNRGYKRHWAQAKIDLAVQARLPAAVDSALLKLAQGYVRAIDGVEYTVIQVEEDPYDIPF